MAQGKLSPRQKMINLMYLVFIAMLALNMSKEVLSAFGLMNERIESSNVKAEDRNTKFMQGLAEKVEEQPVKYKPLKEQADQISLLSSEFNVFVEDVKNDLKGSVKDPKRYENMDKEVFLDEKWFVGEKLTTDGQAFVDIIAKYKEGVVNVLGDTNEDIQADIIEKFSTNDVQDSEGVTKSWMDYHFKGFPLIASLTKLTQMQADVKTIESEVLSTMLEGKLKIEASLTNFVAIVVPDKTAFFNGENFKGRVILGKNDPTLRADKVIINGQELDADALQAGQAVLDFPAGAVGERDIVGEFQFMEDGEQIIIPVKSTYAVVPKPNSATISADKMNVVYRGVQNPMTISFAGVSDNNVSASAQGLAKAGGVGKYVMDVTRIQGREVTINVTGTLPDGSKVSDAAKFRIKDIPKPVGTVRGEDGAVKMQRNSLEISTIGAKLDDFDFDLKLNVNGFKFKVPGQPTINVSGSKLNSRAKSALRKAKRGAAVQVFGIQAKIASNSGYKLKKVSPVIIELTN
jgi:gliding motility-associated protein GldM